MSTSYKGLRTPGFAMLALVAMLGGLPPVRRREEEERPRMEPWLDLAGPPPYTNPELEEALDAPIAPMPLPALLPCRRFEPDEVPTPATSAERATDEERATAHHKGLRHLTRAERKAQKARVPSAARVRREQPETWVGDQCADPQFAKAFDAEAAREAQKARGR